MLCLHQANRRASTSRGPQDARLGHGPPRRLPNHSAVCERMDHAAPAVPTIQPYTVRTNGGDVELDLGPLLGWQQDGELRDFLDDLRTTANGGAAPVDAFVRLLADTEALIRQLMIGGYAEEVRATSAPDSDVALADGCRTRGPASGAAAAAAAAAAPAAELPFSSVDRAAGVATGGAHSDPCSGGEASGIGGERSGGRHDNGGGGGWGGGDVASYDDPWVGGGGRGSDQGTGDPRVAVDDVLAASGALLELCWEKLHLGYWKDVQLAWRNGYSLACITHTWLRLLLLLPLPQPPPAPTQNACRPRPRPPAEPVPAGSSPGPPPAASLNADPTHNGRCGATAAAPAALLDSGAATPGASARRGLRGGCDYADGGGGDHVPGLRLPQQRGMTGQEQLQQQQQGQQLREGPQGRAGQREGRQAGQRRGQQQPGERGQEDEDGLLQRCLRQLDLGLMMGGPLWRIHTHNLVDQLHTAAAAVSVCSGSNRPLPPPPVLFSPPAMPAAAHAGSDLVSEMAAEAAPGTDGSSGGGEDAGGSAGGGGGDGGVRPEPKRRRCGSGSFSAEPRRRLTAAMPAHPQQQHQPQQQVAAEQLRHRLLAAGDGDGDEGGCAAIAGDTGVQLPHGSLGGPPGSRVPAAEQPGLEEFLLSYMVPGRPVVVTGAMEHWPAMERWDDLSYLKRAAGGRTVPVEVGEHYLAEGWGQQLMTLSHFLHTHVGSGTTVTTRTENTMLMAAPPKPGHPAAPPAASLAPEPRPPPPPPRGYLAQHPLFEQVPALRSDIAVPDYCVLGEEGQVVAVNAWLGPGGTTTPLHTDPHHNLLAQVVGRKYVRLYEPRLTPQLHPFPPDTVNSNSSQVDLDLDLEPDSDADLEPQGEEVQEGLCVTGATGTAAAAPVGACGGDGGLGDAGDDVRGCRHRRSSRFPGVATLPYQDVVLEPGQMLYIPPGWWHFVRALTTSFSVSFWWR